MYVDVSEKHGYTLHQPELDIHAALLKRSWNTYYHGQILHKIVKTSAKGAIATTLARLQLDMEKKGVLFAEMDVELKDKCASFTKFGLGPVTPKSSSKPSQAASSSSKQ